MHVVALESETDPRWQRLLGRYRSDVFHSPAWIHVLRETYGLQFCGTLLLDGDGEPIAGLPLCAIDDMLGQRYIGLPFSDYCDPLVADADQWRILADHLLAAGWPLLVRCLHNDIPLADERFARTKQAKWHGLDLSCDIDQLWQQVDPASRRAIKKARGSGVTVRKAEELADLRAFYDLHVQVRKQKYRLLPQPYAFFEAIWRYPMADEMGTLLLAEYEGALIAGVLFLVWNNRLYYKFNASSANHLEQRPNDLLAWEGIVYGKERGLTFLDFGLSDWDQEGLIRYKRKFASEEKTISFLHYLPAGRPTLSEQRMRSLLPKLTTLFTDASVPDSVTAAAGAELYQFFT